MSFTVANSILPNPKQHRVGINNETEQPKPAASGASGASGAPVVNALTVSSNIYALNVFLNTFLFILVFVCGSAWSTACLEYVRKAPSAKGMLSFSFFLTLITCCLAIGFGELSRINSRIQVDYQSDLG